MDTSGYILDELGKWRRRRRGCEPPKEHKVPLRKRDWKAGAAAGRNATGIGDVYALVPALASGGPTATEPLPIPRRPGRLILDALRKASEPVPATAIVACVARCARAG
jgi:hypothetical protein